MEMNQQRQGLVWIHVWANKESGALQGLQLDSPSANLDLRYARMWPSVVDHWGWSLPLLRHSVYVGNHE
jgi:hypothetical protein